MISLYSHCNVQLQSSAEVRYILLSPGILPVHCVRIVIAIVRDLKEATTRKSRCKVQSNIKDHKVNQNQENVGEFEEGLIDVRQEIHLYIHMKVNTEILGEGLC